MKKLFAILIVVCIITFANHAHATAQDWVIFSGSDDIVVISNDGGFKDIDDTLTIYLENKDASIPVDTSLLLPDDPIMDRVLAEWSNILDGPTRQTLTQAGSLQGRFVMLVLDFSKISIDAMNYITSSCFTVTQKNDAYAALGISAPDLGELDLDEFMKIDIMAIPIIEGVSSSLVISCMGDEDEDSGIRPIQSTFTIIIDSTGLSFTQAPANIEHPSESAPQSMYTTDLIAGSIPPIIYTSGNVYNGVGDFLIQTGTMKSQLKGIAINGAALIEGLDYAIEETPGNIAAIRVFESVMRHIAAGSAQITISFLNGSINASVEIAGFYVPDEILTDPPKTGDAKSVRGFYALLCGLALALAADRRRREELIQL